MNLLPVDNYYKKILQVALPAIAGLSTQMVVSLVDAAMVGRLTEATYALAAMGIGVLATWALVSFFSSLATGTQVLVARNFGSKDYLACSKVLNNSLMVGFIIGIFAALAAAFGAKPISNLLAADKEVGKYAAEFIFFRFLGIPFFLLSVSFRGFFFGIGKTKIFMFSGIVTNILNIIFNYFLVFGSFGAPRLGLAGAGLGSSLATFFDASFYFIVLMLPSYRSKYQNFKHFKLDFKIIKNLYKISLPVSFQNIFILIGFLIFIIFTGFIGTKDQAASQAVISTLFISFLPCFGFGIAAQTLVGNNIGSQRFDLAKIYGYETAKIATYYTLALAMIYIFLPQYVLLIITTNQSIIETAKPALRIAGFAQIFYASGVVLANGLQAAGKTFFVMMSEVIANLFIFVPLAYFLGVFLKLGLTWAWAALPVYIIIYSLIIFLKFRFGKWHT
ncbi:MAG: MATE family efflux transporter [Ignavibacteriaceae bacterium]